MAPFSCRQSAERVRALSEPAWLLRRRPTRVSPLKAYTFNKELMND